MSIRTTRFALAAAVLLLAGLAAVAAPPQPQPVNPALTPPAPGGAQVPAHRPDLVVVSLDLRNPSVTPNPDGSRRVGFTPAFTYKNAGNARSGEFRLVWEYMDPATGQWQWWLAPFWTNDLAPGQSWSQGGQPADYLPLTIPAGAPLPKFRVRLDTLGQVAESDETNNEKTRQLLVAAPAMPTLQPVTPPRP
ncbi:MAG: hypothetical protein M5U13_15515 [Thermoanaerobaculia bacterium]|nr:hypothetical protein [Thermoanaerobaculia bacterium]